MATEFFVSDAPAALNYTDSVQWAIDQAAAHAASGPAASTLYDPEAEQYVTIRPLTLSRSDGAMANGSNILTCAGATGMAAFTIDDIGAPITVGTRSGTITALQNATNEKSSAVRVSFTATANLTGQTVGYVHTWKAGPNTLQAVAKIDISGVINGQGVTMKDNVRLLGKKGEKWGAGTINVWMVNTRGARNWSFEQYGTDLTSNPTLGGTGTNVANIPVEARTRFIVDQRTHLYNSGLSGLENAKFLDNDYDGTERGRVRGIYFITSNDCTGNFGAGGGSFKSDTAMWTPRGRTFADTPKNIHWVDCVLDNGYSGYGMMQTGGLWECAREHCYEYSGTMWRDETDPAPHQGAFGMKRVISYNGFCERGNAAMTWISAESTTAFTQCYALAISSYGCAEMFRLGIQPDTPNAPGIDSTCKIVDSWCIAAPFAQLQESAPCPTNRSRHVYTLGGPGANAGNIFQNLRYNERSEPGTASNTQYDFSAGHQTAVDDNSLTYASMLKRWRDLRQAWLDGDTNPPPPVNFGVGGTLGFSGSLAIAEVTTPIQGNIAADGTLGFSGALDIEALPLSSIAPEFTTTPDDPSTSQIGFFRAELPIQARWLWSIDGGGEVVAGVNSETDSRAFEVSRGSHEVLARGILPDGSSTLPAVYEWTVTDILTPRPISDLLGCGVYSCYVKLQGGQHMVGALPFTSLSWERVLDGTGQAQVQLDGLSDFGTDCCSLIGVVRPWAYEIAIYRDNMLIWQGPLVAKKLSGEQASLTFRDGSAWLAKRPLPRSLAHTQTDLARIAKDYADAGLGIDSRHRITSAIMATTGTLADRAQEPFRATVADLVDELARTGLSWTTLGRQVRFGVREANTTAAARLLDGAFIQPPEVAEDGTDQANSWVVLGEGQGEGIDQPFGQSGNVPAFQDDGYIWRVVQESEIKDKASAQAAAVTRATMNARGQATISGGTLDRRAPVTIDKLVPGKLLDIRLGQTCIPVAGVHRLLKVSGAGAQDGSEEIKLDVELA